MLKVSFVGMKTRVVKITSGIMNIILQDDVQEIEEWWSPAINRLKTGFLQGRQLR